MKTTVVASMELALVVKLDEAAKQKRVSASVIVSAALQHFLAEHIADAVLIESHGGNTSNRDGRDDAARAIIKANDTLSIPALTKLLADSDIKRGKTWVAETRMSVRGTGSRHTEGT